MFEIKVTLGLDTDTKDLLARYLNLVEAGKMGEPHAAEPAKQTEPQKKPVNRAQRAESPTVEETPKTKADAPTEPKKQPQDEPRQDTGKASYDIEDIRALLADAKHNYGIDVVKGLLKKYGAATGKLAEVPADKYAALADDITALGKGEA